MKISIKHDLDKVAKKLKNIQKKQIPFAASQAINDTVQDAQRAVVAQMDKKLDRPTPATRKGVRIRRASKRTLTGAVFIIDPVWEYLRYQVEGGVRHARGAGTGVPVNARLNKYGNIPSRRKGLVKNRRQFIATIKGITGVWERTGRGGKQIKLITAFEKQVTYSRRLDYHRIVQGVAKNNFNRHFERRLQAALATAR